MVSLKPHSKPYTVRPFALVSQKSIGGTVRRKRNTSTAWNYDIDCETSASALSQGLFQSTLQRGKAKVQSMTKQTSVQPTKQTTQEQTTSKVMRLQAQFRSYAPGQSLEFKIMLKLYTKTVERGEDEFGEKMVEIPSRLVLEYPGAQPWKLQFWNGTLYKSGFGDVCQLSPALKRIGFRFRRLVSTKHDARRVPRETYLFTISGDPFHRDLDGEFYQTRKGRLRLVHKTISDQVKEERWVGLSGALKGKPMLNRYGYATAIRTKDKEDRLSEVAYLDVSGNPVVPKGVRFARRTITWTAKGYKQREAFWGVDGKPAYLERNGQQCEAYRWKKPDACECKQATDPPMENAWVKCATQ